MKTGTIKRIANWMVALVVFVAAAAQAQISPADALLLQKAENDTVQLRKIVKERQGNRIAARAQNRIGMIAYDKGRYDDAEREHRATYQQYINTPEAQAAAYELGRVKFKKHQFPEAKKYIKEYLKTQPTGLEAERAKFLYIQLMEETKDAAYADSIRTYLAAPHAAMKAKDPLVHYGLVRHYVRTGDIAKTLEEAKILVQKYPKTKYANFAESRIVDSYCMMGKPKEAEKFCRSLLKKYPATSEEAARVHRMMGSIYMNSAQYNLSRKEYKEQIRQGIAGSPRVMKAEYALTIVDVREGRAKNDTMLLATAMNKLKIFAKKYSEDPWSSRAWMDIADLSLAKGDKSSALAAYDRILAFDTAYIAGRKISRHSNMYLEQLERIKQAHISKGLLIQDPAVSLKEFESVLAENPEHTGAQLNKARCLRELGRQEEAREILTTLIQTGRDVKKPAEEMLRNIENVKEDGR